VWTDLLNDRRLGLSFLVQQLDRKNASLSSLSPSSSTQAQQQQHSGHDDSLTSVEASLSAPSSTSTSSLYSAHLQPHLNAHLADFGFMSAQAAVQHGNKSIAKLHVAASTELLRAPTPSSKEVLDQRCICALFGYIPFYSMQCSFGGRLFAFIYIFFFCFSSLPFSSPESEFFRLVFFSGAPVYFSLSNAYCCCKLSLQLNRVKAVSAFNRYVLLGSSDDPASAWSNLADNPKEHKKALANIHKTTVTTEDSPVLRLVSFGASFCPFFFSFKI
jgi:hypothetical protein